MKFEIDFKKLRPNSVVVQAAFSIFFILLSYWLSTQVSPQGYRIDFKDIWFIVTSCVSGIFGAVTLIAIIDNKVF